MKKKQTTNQEIQCSEIQTTNSEEDSLDLDLVVLKSSLRIKSRLMPTDRHLANRQAVQRRLELVTSQ